MLIVRKKKKGKRKKEKKKGKRQKHKATIILWAINH